MGIIICVPVVFGISYLISLLIGSDMFEEFFITLHNFAVDEPLRFTLVVCAVILIYCFVRCSREVD